MDEKEEIRLEKTGINTILINYLENMKILRGGAVVARQAHNLKAEGSIPSPATNLLLKPTLKII